MKRLQAWRDKYEKSIDARPTMQPLSILSHYLNEFQYSKVDEIEVPGQYLEVRESLDSCYEWTLTCSITTRKRIRTSRL